MSVFRTEETASGIGGTHKIAGFHDHKISAGTMSLKT
jgi:hypothetical protein